MPGKPASRTCPICDAALEPEMRFCWHCGAGARREFPTAPRSAAPKPWLLILSGVVALLAGVGVVVNGGNRGTPGASVELVCGLAVGFVGALICVIAGRMMAERR
ncbi:MAG: hypothetical protein HYU66_25905 [Armatimonadetes bacterium]|nr:hypothetical protein [Armatimonadota bacterium]